MRQHTTVTLCDVCLDGDTTEPRAAVYSYLIQSVDGSMYRYRIDLCIQHAKTSTLVDILPLGKPWAPPRPRIGRPLVDCPHCGQVMSAGSGLALHTKARHPEHWARVGDR